jgi:mono/diheme cytochrome c family protein
MARRDLNLEDEKRSYAGLWLLCAALLVVGAIWTLLDDTVLRRPWKQVQNEFFALEKSRAIDALEAEDAKLAGHDGYQELVAQKADAEAKLDNPSTQTQLAELRAQVADLTLDEKDADVKVRFIKSELEVSKYEYDHAIQHGGDVAAARDHRDDLNRQRIELEAAWGKAQLDLETAEYTIAKIETPVTAIVKQMNVVAVERLGIQTKLDQMKSNIGDYIETEKIPTIHQVVLPDFDINNFAQPVGRVDRCQTCHIGIGRRGFEEDAQPLGTHPDREMYIGKHPSNKFGCTPCHDGQGVALNSVDQAHGDVVFWLKPLLRGPQQQARCLDCHRDVSSLQGAENLARGEQLFEQLGCHGCHLVEGYSEMDNVGPSLRKESAKVDPQWLVDWIRDPFAFRPRTKMPDFELNDAEATAIAAYIWSSSKEDGDAWSAEHPEVSGVDAGNAELVAAGETVFNEVGCRGCHAVGEDDIARPVGATKDWAPNLTRVAQKTNGSFLYWWVKNPSGWNAHTRMPSLRLSDEEARGVASYLLSIAPDMAEAPAATVTAQTLENPEQVERGAALVRKYGCSGCHEINGMDAESRIGVELSTFASKPLSELFFGNTHSVEHDWNAWTYSKLEDPRIYETEHVEQVMPNFHLSEEDIIDLRVWLASRTGKLPPMKYRQKGYDARWAKVQKGRRLVDKFNCMGCHEIDGEGGYIRRLYGDNPTEAPPILFDQGNKVQPEWFFGFLQDPALQPLRFWLKVRMPTFPLTTDETTAIIEYFTAKSDLKNPFFFWDPKVDSTPELLHTGDLLMSDEYFSCWSCHVMGDKTPAGPMQYWAPNLAFAHERLNPEWILRWIADPQSQMPGTKMPAFYPGGPEDIFDGDEPKQILAMRDWIMSLNYKGGDAAASDELTEP